MQYINRFDVSEDTDVNQNKCIKVFDIFATIGIF